MRSFEIHRRILLASGVGLLVACGAEVDKKASTPDTPIVSDEALMVSDSWAGHQVGLEAPIVRDVGPLDRDGTHDSETSVSVDPGSDMVIFDATRDVRYRLDFDHAALRAAAEKMREIAITKAGRATAQPEGEELVKKALVGNDGRQRFGIADGYSKDYFPLSTIGKVRPDAGSFCSGTLIADRLVLTSAHCVLTTSYQFLQGFFDPRIDGTNSNVYLNPVQPFGSWRYSGAAVSNEFINRNCLSNGAGAGGTLNNPNLDCFGADFAILIVDKPAGVTHPGGMCFGWNSNKNVLNGSYIYSRGYPACGISGAPNNCKNDTLYGDSRDCQLGADVSFDSSGFPRATDFDCDISAGQSGSPVYVSYPSWLPSCSAVVIGVESGNRPLNGAYINVMRRISPELSDFMVLLDSLF